MDSSSDRGVEDDLEFEVEENNTPFSEVEDDDGEKTSVAFDASKFEAEAQQALKSQILILCTALGGADVSGKYVLGTDALACLKDLKRWIKVVDDASDNWNVASACDDNGLVLNDLIPILVELPSRINDANRSFYTGILLSVLELLVALTRPLVLDTERATAAKVDLYIKLKKSHVKYKDRILNYENGKCLKSVVGLAIPIFRTRKDQRSSRDIIILNLCLNLFRNVIRIEPADVTIGTRRASSKTQQLNDNMPPGVDKDDISFSRLVAVYRKNKVLQFIQTITSGLEREFEPRVLGSVCLDVYFYLLYGLDPATVAVKREPESISGGAANGLSLGAALDQEKLMKKRLLNNNVTRHANFGTLLSIRQNDDSQMTVSGQKRLIHSDLLEQLDASRSKKTVGSRWTTNKNESTRSDFDRHLSGEPSKYVDTETRATFGEFCHDFVEAGFGPLLAAIRKSFIGEHTRFGAFLEFHYFYVVGWVLKFERLLRESSRENVFRLGYLQEALSQDMVRLILKNNIPLYMQNREHNLLRIAVNCFKEILLTVVDMHKLEPHDYPDLSPEQKDELDMYQGMSEQVLRLIFSSEDEIEVFFHVAQDAHKVSFSYALDMIDYTHVLLKVLQYLSELKTPVAMGKKRRGKAKEDRAGSDSDSMGESHLKRYLQFDRSRYEFYERKLMHERVVNCYVSVFAKFDELNEVQVRKCISFFNRLMLKKDEHFLKLVRLDFMLALHDIKDSVFGSSVKRDLGRLLGYYMHTFEKKYRQTDAILLDLLTLGQDSDRGLREFLQTGDRNELEAREHAKRSRDVSFAAAEMSYSHKISVLVSALVYRDSVEILEYLVSRLRARDGELVFESGRETLRNGHYRLLLETIGFEVATNGQAVLPGTVEDSHVTMTADLIEESKLRPLETDEFEHELIEERREPEQEPEREQTSNFDDFGSDNDLETLNRVSERLDRLDVLEARLEKKTGRKRVRDPEDDEIRFKSKAKAKKKGHAKKVKRVAKEKASVEPKVHLSSKYVDSEDDLSDAEKEAEFFRKEQELQALIQRNGGAISPEQFQQLLGGGEQRRDKMVTLSDSESEPSSSPPPVRRARAVIEDDDD
ncbi:hypothetical protein OGAPHI_006645 [Ogataea philodendri]|uniref:Topoisomerase 1-associated factor 1 n=1 Tax=Ogataea philodendri TaxID=1378263 RepID=A0A9P8NVV9_9ASCO|nr:uncharacterized protein OGAPHI_006645 [Ogataea philodendri]KAH3661238.1 hypothetical protein OGAPHI_006645 [Ogataea philodendri]